MYTVGNVNKQRMEEIPQQTQDMPQQTQIDKEGKRVYDSIYIQLCAFL